MRLLSMGLILVLFSVLGCKSREKESGSFKQDNSSELSKRYYLLSLDEYSRDPSRTILNTYNGQTAEIIKSGDNRWLGMPCWAVSLLIKRDPTILNTFGRLYKNANPEEGKEIFLNDVMESCSTDPKRPIGVVSKKTNEIDQQEMATIAKKMNELVFTKSFNDDEIFSALGDSLSKTGACVMTCDTAESRFCKSGVESKNCTKPEQGIDVFGIQLKCPFTLKYYGGVSCARLGIRSL